MGIRYISNRAERPADFIPAPVTCAETAAAHTFHCGMEGYAATPLADLPALAEKLGIAQMLVKDESKRFGLNAFKALGGSYAIARYLCGKTGIPLDAHAFARLRTPELHEKIKDITFVTATDGNHGRGVAWTAMMLGCRAAVYMPEGSARERLENIQKTGAYAEITPYIYDDAVRYAGRMARENGWILVQDTAWRGYEEIPADIMRGYTTISWEIDRQLQEQGWEKPTHLFLQAGVGSMAAAIAGHAASLWGEERPRIVVVEPESADCFYRTAEADDGELHAVTEKMDSMMAGLCCGEPCTLAWDILKVLADGFLACDDGYSALGMRALGKPLASDPAIVSGESGAVTAGVTVGILTEPELAWLKEELKLDGHSRVLVISTEGDTDRENYQRILRGEPESAAD